MGIIYLIQHLFNKASEGVRKVQVDCFLQMRPSMTLVIPLKRAVGKLSLEKSNCLCDL